jgi:1-deoxy-D-xylulose-5-phosphate synthase
VGRRRKVLAVIGDGALSGGMAYEALNNLGSSDKPMVVVLNDNEMSIGENVGAMADSLSRIITGELGRTFRQNVRSVLNNIPIGDRLKGLARKFEESALSFFTPGIIFEELGLRYIGPIDGHDIKELEKALNTAFSYNSPALVHVQTVKGRGYAPAEVDPCKFHGIAPFDIATGEVKAQNKPQSWTDVFSAKILAMAEADKRVVAITAAMGDGTGLTDFAKAYPKRFFDVGIAEQHALTFAAGLAVSGLRPYVALYSTFAQRAFDQLMHDVALQKLPVRLCIDRAGLVGEDGATHHGAFDISFLRLIPNMTLFLPRCGRELEDMLALSVDVDGPVAIRYGRGAAPTYDEIPYKNIELFQPEIVYCPIDSEIAIISVGHIFDEALAFYKILLQNGYKAKLINLRFVPFDKEALLSQLDVASVYIFEENVYTGSVSELLKSLIYERYRKININALTLPDHFIPHGSVKELRKLYRLTAEYAWELKNK